MDVLLKTYRETGTQPIPRIHLSDEEYGRGLQCFVVASTDIVLVNLDLELFFLARRKAKPVPGWWWLGGRMQPGETEKESAVRCLRRETGLEISPDRLTLVGIVSHICKDREQGPQNLGCHMLAYTFTLEISRDELRQAAAQLDPNEYDRASGLRTFDRNALIKAGVRPQVLDLHRHVFPS